MRRLTVYGIPTFVADCPGPISAGLVFGVGRRDETFVRGGVTHLVEHLAMSAVRHGTLDANASVGFHTTEFTATGAPDRVVAFLRSVCEALAELPTARLAVEADVLRAEAGQPAPPVVCALLTERYGVSGLGLAGMREPALRSLTADDVRNWAGRFFTRSNAALWLSGPLPEAIVLPLPDGPVPARSGQARRDLRLPAWTELPSDGRVALSGEVPSGPGLGAMLGILRERGEEELRHRRGVAYAVEVDRVAVDAGTDFVVLTSDARPGREHLAARLLWAELERLTEDGPRADELDRQREQVAALLDDPWSAAREAQALALGAVTGMPAPSAEELLRDAGALPPEAVREAAVHLRDAALLAVPVGAQPPPVLPRLPQFAAEVVTGRSFRPTRGSGAPRSAALVVGEQGASIVVGDEERATVRWTETVGLVRSGSDEWCLVGRDGSSVPVVAADWRDGAEAVTLVRAAVPAELQVSDDDLDDGVLVLRAPRHRVREAVTVSRDSVELVGDDEWTVVLPDGVRTAGDRALALADAAGRRTVALVLRRDHADLEYVLLRGGREVDRHRWGLAPGDPRLLAEAVGRPVDEVAAVLADDGGPDAALSRLVTLLGLPADVPGLVAGRRPGATERVEGVGVVGGMRALARGELDPPAGTGGWVGRWLSLGRTRPAWYRAANALAAVLLTLSAVRLLATGDGWWTDVVGVLWAVFALGCLWDVRPPRRPARSVEAPVAATAPAGERAG